MSEEQMKKYMTEQNSQGTRFVEVEVRSWWNPLRYIKGEIYYKKI